MADHSAIGWTQATWNPSTGCDQISAGCGLPLPGRVIGAKPAAFCRWLFDLLGAAPGDTLDDLYPGSGAVARAWNAYTTGQPETSRTGPHDASPEALADTSPAAARDRSSKSRADASRRAGHDRSRLPADATSDGPGVVGCLMLRASCRPFALTAETVTGHLTAAALAAGLEAGEAERTITSGLRAGAKRPRVLAPAGGPEVAA